MKSANQTKPVFDYKASRVIVADASARALAASSLRAGLPVSTIDLFADADTVAICRKSNDHLLSNQTANFTMQCESMEQIAQRVEQVLGDADFQTPSGPPMILIGGGLENYFRNQNYFRNHSTCHKLTQQTSAFGFIETGRWRSVKEFCHLNSVRFPPTTQELATSEQEQEWLVKTDFTSGGVGVQFAQSKITTKPDQYFQKYIDGQPFSACYVAVPGGENAEFPVVEMVGVCEPICSSDLGVLDRTTNQRFPFRYRGSVGPIKPSRLVGPSLAEVKRVGSLVANHFGLAGIFGIDFIHQQDILWLLEINPRITASAELIEYAARETMPSFSIVQLHLDALARNLTDMSALVDVCQSASPADRIFAKRIVYRHHEAKQPLRLSLIHI